MNKLLQHGVSVVTVVASRTNHAAFKTYKTVILSCNKFILLADATTLNDCKQQVQRSCLPASPYKAKAADQQQQTNHVAHINQVPCTLIALQQTLMSLVYTFRKVPSLRMECLKHVQLSHAAQIYFAEPSFTAYRYVYILAAVL
jgi:hypothetical protein